MAIEAELLTKAQTGDRQSLNQLVDLYWHDLYRYVFYKVRHKEETEELTQDIFEKVITYLPRYEERGVPFRKFLFRIAANSIIDYWRKKGRSGETLPLAEAFAVCSGDGPDELAILAERKAIINGAVMQLSEEQRQVIQLRLIEGRPIKEVAGVMRKSEGALKMLQQRALQNIRKHIQGKIS